jgi:hypothetical protein
VVVLSLRVGSPPVLSPCTLLLVQVVASVLAAVFPDEDGDAREVAAEMIIEQKEALVTAKAKGELSDGVLEVISGVSIPTPFRSNVGRATDTLTGIHSTHSFVRFAVPACRTTGGVPKSKRCRPRAFFCSTASGRGLC